VHRGLVAHITLDHSNLETANPHSFLQARAASSLESYRSDHLPNCKGL